MLLAATLLLVLSPLFLIIILVLSVANQGAGVFFVQERPGLHARLFHLIKFKTMTDRCDETGRLLPDKERFTKVGRWIRAASLDELPQLLNILKGDMSLIGPRPLMPQFLPLYTEVQSRRHEVRPGITGLAQVNGRHLLKFSEKFRYDVQYVDEYGFGMDWKIFWKTVSGIFKRKDIGNGADDMILIDDLGFAERMENNFDNKETLK